MALVKRNSRPVTYSWNIRDTKKTQHKLPKLEKPPVIDYDKLRELCLMDSFKNRYTGAPCESNHDDFMANYHKMFVKPPKKFGLPIHSEKRSEHRGSALSVSHKATGSESGNVKKPVKREVKSADPTSHNISDYLPLLHKERKSEDPSAIRSNNIRFLRRILRKVPFERTAAENDRVFSILRNFPFFAQCVEASVLKELCVVAQLEVWKEKDFTIFGNTGLHMIVKGSVIPLTSPYVNTTNSQMDFRSPTPIEEDAEELEVGECFGTLVKIEGRLPSTKVLSVKTAEDHVEFVKISASNYKRVIEKIKEREQTEKLNLLLSGEQYSMWPRQPLTEVAGLIEWIHYPPNTVVVSEGYKSPFIGFIKSGECHVLRQVEALETTKTGQERRTKQVVMGRLKPSDSFAELSVLLDEPITCSIVTATDIELGVIKPERISELDEVTVQLFKQSNNRTFGDLTKSDIQEEYIQQEIKREWNEFKHSVVVDVINSRGIRPGYGRWAK